MVEDLCLALDTLYDAKTFSLRLPQTLDQIRGIEKVSSNTAKSLRLFYCYKKVVKSLGLIFINK